MSHVTNLHMKNIGVFWFYDVNMSTKSKTESEFSRVSLGEYFLKLGSVVTTYNSYKRPYFC